MPANGFFSEKSVFLRNDPGLLAQLVLSITLTG